MKLIPMMIVLGLSLSLCNIAEKLKGSKNNNANSSTANSNDASKSDKSGLPPADKPQPTSAQTAAIAGGQSVTWDQQGITWTVPAKWTRVNVDATTFNWKSPGSFDAGFLIGHISPMPENFQTDVGIKATYDQAVGRKKIGEVSSVRWLEIDGVRGVEFLETPPGNKEDSRRLQWLAYRKFAGQTQLITLVLSSEGRHFDMHSDELFGILYSMKVVHE